MYFEVNDGYIDLSDLSGKCQKSLSRKIIITATLQKRIFTNDDILINIYPTYRKYLSEAYTFTEVLEKQRSNFMIGCLGLYRETLLISDYLIKMHNFGFISNMSQPGILSIGNIDTHNGPIFKHVFYENKELCFQIPYVSLIAAADRMEQLVNAINYKYHKLISVKYFKTPNNSELTNGPIYNFKKEYPMFTDNKVYHCYVFFIKSFDKNNYSKNYHVFYIKMALSDFLFETLIREMSLIK